ncbi:NADH-quinone oxidoreductase subunit M [Gordonia hirsuta DSM 44140 = NBRC 16056]|uniref:NADH-quinone oxidoreductase subunit M n=1 Tax=Gordonia hirsuta DSM 44140 = NBRC 16056 TaxID=1121927 RepID=L7LC60_9ACTN|nr:NADH-quinone oxidoreductase subunit M [Gordonia hirsuta]GAC57623.1 NADH-quinone oxidoreductase subunit M [Gordonia hirsuta DSM 44140 = NBRC 16056]
MTAVPWLTVLWLIPAAASLAVLAVPAHRADTAKALALGASVVTAVWAVLVAVRFSAAGPRFQLIEDVSWIPAIGASYSLALDGIGLALLLLTALLAPVLIGAGWHEADISGRTTARGTHTFFALLLATEAMVLISFVATDVLLFYIVFEAMLIPMYFLIGGYGTGPNASRAAVKFLLYNLLGGLVMLAAVIGLYVVTTRSGPGTFSLSAIGELVRGDGLAASSSTLNLLFLGFLFAFAVKAPLWPLHSWLPDAAVAATPASAVLMMAVMDKVGTFAMLRFCLELFPEASATFAPVICVLAVISVIYGAIVAIGQTDLMRLIAYTSISHFGFIVLGIFALTAQGQAGSTLYMVNHGISTAALFLIAGFLVTQRGSRRIADYGGTAKVAPVLAGTFLVAGLATLSLPGLAPFISEFLVLIGTYVRYPVAAVVASVALVLSALYILWTYQRMFGGPAHQPGPIRDLDLRQRTVAGVLIAALLVLGLFPGLILDFVDPAVSYFSGSLR